MVRIGVNRNQLMFFIFNDSRNVFLYFLSEIFFNQIFSPFYCKNELKIDL